MIISTGGGPSGNLQPFVPDLSIDDTRELRRADHGLVRARETLLDALDSLGAQRNAVVLVGAQAVYEHTKLYREAPLTLTNDGDLGVDPSLVTDDPNIDSAMRDAGFTPHRDRPGIWIKHDGSEKPPSVDLLAADAVAGKGSRAARIAGQPKSAVGRAKGLELALLDNTVMRLDSLADDSDRSCEIKVGSAAALVCAKAFKLGERIDARDGGGRDRVKSKDAGDVWRLMATCDAAHARKVIDQHQEHPMMGDEIRKGREYIAEVFSADGVGENLAVLDLADAVPEETVRDVMRRWMSAFRG
ncbi:MAG TPA: hypothetical protein VF444_16630 [Pseudonocardiaceae bacterium]